MKRFFKILGIALIALVLLILASPYLFKSQISDLIKDKLNQSLNATVDFSDLDLSFFSAFPDARVGLENLSVINKEPFAGDTLFYAREIKLDMPLGDVFNSAGEPIRLNEIIVNGAVANFLVDQDGNANWDIAKETTASNTPQKADTSKSGFSFDLKHYEVNDSYLIYNDLTSTNYLKLDSLNHKGDGDFSLDSSTLNTYTQALVTYSLDSVEYLSARAVELDADILMNLNEQKYTFQENNALINDLEIKLDGYVQLFDERTMVDLSFNTPSSDFKNFFALIPEVYRGNLDGITTNGDFVLAGTVKGEVTEERIPLLDINMSSSNASFKYADLPKRVENISIKASVKNETGLVEETFVDVPEVQFALSGDRFRGSALIKSLTTNPEVDMTMNGALDFASLEEAIPFPDDTHLNGRLALDAAARFDMASIEQEKYENIYTRGTANLSKFKYEGDALNQPLEINEADLDFSTSRIKLRKFEAVTGNTDLQAAGSINNLIGFLLQDQPLKGAFTVSSNTLDSNDFMTAQSGLDDEPKESKSDTASNNSAVQIPALLDAQLDFKVDRVLYDGLELSNVAGLAIVRDETMTLNNVRTDVFNGNIGVNGSFTTKGNEPRFDMILDMNALDIASSFQGLEMLQKLVPVVNALKGTISTDLKLSGDLNGNLAPVVSSLTGDAFAQVLTKDVDLSANPLLNRLDNELDFLNLGSFSLSDLQAKLKFENGLVNIQPFDFSVKDINITASGSHSLQNEMDYVLDLNVPAKYLGKDGASLLSKLEDKEVDEIDVPIPVQLNGSITQPKVKVNMQQAITNLSNQIIDIQKQKLKDKGKDKLNETLNDLFNTGSGNDRAGQGNGTSDSTVTTPKPNEQQTKDKLKEAAGGLIRDLFKKKKDTTRSK